MTVSKSPAMERAAALAPHTKMEYLGMTRAESRANVIDYVKTLK